MKCNCEVVRRNYAETIVDLGGAVGVPAYRRAAATAAKTERRDRVCECMVSVYSDTRGPTRETRDETKGTTRRVHTKQDTHIRRVTLMSAQVPNMGGDSPSSPKCGMRRQHYSLKSS